MTGCLIGYKPSNGDLEVLTEDLVERFGDLLLAVVFGSVARGAASEISDTNLLIIRRWASTGCYEGLEPVLAAKRFLPWKSCQT